MSSTKAFVNELKAESAATKKILERVPGDKTGWKPHEKSMTLGRVATHIAEIPSWVTLIATTNEIDLLKRNPKTYTAKDSEELVSLHAANVEEAIKALENIGEEDLAKPWQMRRGDVVVSEMPKADAIRRMALNHAVHHRGQLSVFLRLLDVPVPGMYGPSADEK